MPYGAGALGKGWGPPLDHPMAVSWRIPKMKTFVKLPPLVELPIDELLDLTSLKKRSFWSHGVFR